MPETLTLDPTSEDAANVPLELMPADGSISVVEHRYPMPPLEFQWASSVDTEGERAASRRYQNRTVSLQLEAWGTSAATLQTVLRSIESKVAKLAANGGTLKRVLVGGQTIILDVIGVGSYEPTFDLAYHNGHMATISLELVCEPLGRGEPVNAVSQGSLTAGLDAVRIETWASIPGDVPALGRLVVLNNTSNQQHSITWGLRAKHYTTVTNSDIFIRADSATLQNAYATQTAGPAGAFGTGNNVMRAVNVPGSYKHLTKVGLALRVNTGTYRVLARVHTPAANAGDVTLRFQWQLDEQISNVPPWDVIADGAVNDPVTIPKAHYGGDWVIVDLGLITLPEPRYQGTYNVDGTAYWTGVIQGKATGTEQVDINWLLLMPAAEGGGITTGLTDKPVLYSNLTWEVTGVGARTAFGSENIERPYSGSYLTIPPSSTPVQTVVKASRGVPITAAGPPAQVDPSRPYYPSDDASDSVSTSLVITPRYLVIPN